RTRERVSSNDVIELDEDDMIVDELPRERALATTAIPARRIKTPAGGRLEADVAEECLASIAVETARVASPKGLPFPLPAEAPIASAAPVASAAPIAARLPTVSAPAMRLPTLSPLRRREPSDPSLEIVEVLDVDDLDVDLVDPEATNKLAPIPD